MPRRLDKHTFHHAILVALAAVITLVWLACPGKVRAHGDWAHVHVTAWAIENLPEGELRDFFKEPEVFDAALLGGAYPDAGYWVQGDPASRAFAEHSHWEPFIQDFVEHIRENHPPPFDTLEERRLVAFLMGCAAHGLQDEIFDSLFLYQVDEHDGGGQDAADPGTDGFLVDDGYQRFIVPADWLPTDDLVELYADLPQMITGEIIRDAVHTQLVTGYLSEDPGLLIAQSLAATYRAEIPWTAANYMDPDIPGSLISETVPTQRYFEALWKRLHGTWTEDDLVIHVFPEPPRRLRGYLASETDSWATMILGMGLGRDSAMGSVTTEARAELPFELRYTRWGVPYSRLVRFIPTNDLEPGEMLTATLEPGASLIDGTTTTKNASFSFQVQCLPSDTSPCPALADVPVVATDGSPWLDEPELEPSGPDPTIGNGPRDPGVNHDGHDGCGVSAAPANSLASFQLLGLLVSVLLLCSRRRLR